MHEHRVAVIDPDQRNLKLFSFLLVASKFIGDETCTMPRKLLIIGSLIAV